jgi:hypothetical protein
VVIRGAYHNHQQMEDLKAKAEAAAKDCFEYNKNLDKVFVTADCACFPERNHAFNHARALEDKTIEVFERVGDEVKDNADESTEVTEELADAPDLKTAVLPKNKREKAAIEAVVAAINEATPGPVGIIGAPGVSGVPGENTAPATAETQPVPAAEPSTQPAESNIVDKLNHLVSEVEGALGINDNPQAAQ